MKVRFWGTRGSIPTPGEAFLKYGGNTPCLQVTFDTSDDIFILDAGTGIRQLGLEVMNRYDRMKVYLLLTHFHWDHLQGIPFFAPLYSEKCECTFIGCDAVEGNLKKRLHDAVCPPYFPVGFDIFKTKMNFIDICEGNLNIGDINISVIEVNHPGGAVAFRITENGKTCIFMTDNELNSLDPLYMKLVDFCKGADLLIHDAQYTPEEYADKKGWGHSSYVDAVQFAINSDVKKLALFHHDPDYGDDRIDDIVEKSRDLLQARDSLIECVGAREGDESPPL